MPGLKQICKESVPKLRLTFNHPRSELIWFCQKENEILYIPMCKEISEYSNFPTRAA